MASYGCVSFPLAVYSIGGNVKAMRFTYVIDNLPENGIFALVGGKIQTAASDHKNRATKRKAAAATGLWNELIN